MHFTVFSAQREQTQLPSHKQHHRNREVASAPGVSDKVEHANQRSQIALFGFNREDCIIMNGLEIETKHNLRHHKDFRGTVRSVWLDVSDFGAYFHKLFSVKATLHVWANTLAGRVDRVSLPVGTWTLERRHDSLGHKVGDCYILKVNVDGQVVECFEQDLLRALDGVNWIEDAFEIHDPGVEHIFRRHRVETQQVRGGLVSLVIVWSASVQLVHHCRHYKLRPLILLLYLSMGAWSHVDLVYVVELLWSLAIQILGLFETHIVLVCSWVVGCFVSREWFLVSKNAVIHWIDLGDAATSLTLLVITEVV